VLHVAVCINCSSKDRALFQVGTNIGVNAINFKGVQKLCCNKMSEFKSQLLALTEEQKQKARIVILLKWFILVATLFCI